MDSSGRFVAGNVPVYSVSPTGGATESTPGIIKTVINKQFVGTDSSGNLKEATLPSATPSQKGIIKTVSGALVVGTDTNGDLVSRGTVTSTNDGTDAQKDALIATKGYVDKRAFDKTTFVREIFDVIYPVGSIYISFNGSIPSGFLGTWTQLATGRTIWNVASGEVGTLIEAGLPNIVGRYSGAIENASVPKTVTIDGVEYTNALSSYSTDNAAEDDRGTNSGFTLNASKCNPIYGNSTTVQPPAIGVTMFRRTA